MNKLLTEGGWKAIVAKSKIKDNGLQKALAAYEDLDEEDYAGQLKAIASITQLATALKKAKDVATAPAAVKYLADLVSAAASEQSSVAKAKAAADKDAKKAVAGAKKSEDEEEEEEEEEEDGDYAVKLLAAFQKLKGAKDVAYQFIVCDAKPIGLMVAKKITAQHKAALIELTGSKRFLPVGTCIFEDGKFSFSLEKPVTGLARKIQESIKNYTGKKLPIKAGIESAEDEEEESAADEEEAGAAGGGAAPQAVPPPKLGKAELAKAPDVWHGMRQVVDTNIEQVKKAVKAHYANSHPDLIAEIDENLAKLDAITDKLDHRIADALKKAHAAKDDAARKAELKNAKAILAEYIGYVKGEPLIAHIDANPWVKIDLRKTLVETITHMAKSIGA